MLFLISDDKKNHLLLSIIVFFGRLSSAKIRDDLHLFPKCVSKLQRIRNGQGRVGLNSKDKVEGVDGKLKMTTKGSEYFMIFFGATAAAASRPARSAVFPHLQLYNFFIFEKVKGSSLASLTMRSITY